MKIAAKAFSFRNLVRSHGWVFLAPFNWCEERQALERPLHLPSGSTVKFRIRVVPDRRSAVVNVTPPRGAKLTPVERTCVRGQVSRMLRLDEKLSDFHRMCRADRSLAFAAKAACGGMLRCPDPFEDLVKTICTTNCDWRNTKGMCEALCELDGGGFPRPEAILRLSPARLARAVPLGYRGRTVHRVAQLYSEGELPLDSWASAGDFLAIRAALMEIWGIGPYCADHMLVLLGCYEHIPVDSEVLRYLRATHFHGRQVSAQEAVAPYERYGRWRYLAYKFARLARGTNYVDK